MAYTMLEQEKFDTFSFKSGIADLARIEALYQFGGFYFNFKYESLRHLEPFRKYEILFIDCNPTNYYR